jgi:hypothetical protein
MTASKQKAPRNPRGFFNVDYREEDEEEYFAHDLIRKPEDHPGSSPGQAFSGSCVIRPWQAWQRPTLPSLEA